MRTIHARYASASSNSSRRPIGPARPLRWIVRGHLTALALGLGVLLVLVSACGSSAPAGLGPTPTVSPRRATVMVYFTRHPDSDNVPTKVFAVTRAVPTTASTTQAMATYALQQLFAGPTQTERAQGYYSPFDGQMALQSVCPGEFRDFDLTLDHRGTTAEKGTATLQFCRRVDIPGDLDGPRMSTMVTTTLMQFPAITKVVILNYQGDCFDDMQGQNACLSGAQAGYPVKVYFSRHPDSENNFTAVFPVTRTAPTLGVATYAIRQLIAGPTAAEKQAGYYTELTDAINHNDSSSCGGADFTIALNMRGSNPETGTATLRFCRGTNTGGIGADARILSELKATLTQFENIQRVAIVTKSGACFGDMSGRNTCLNPEQAGYAVHVFYSKHPDSDSAPTKVFPLDRTSPTLGVATYALSQLIAGPTPSETAQGYYTPLHGALSGPSTCNGADFNITLNWNRTYTETGTATLQFCRHVAGFGDTGAVLVRNEITKTLTQFPNIQKVVIVYQDGSCFDDQIGCG